MTSTPLFSHILDTEINRAFTHLCVDADPDLLPMLIKDVEQHVFQVRIALVANEFLDVAMAERIAALLKNLLANIESYPAPKQRLIVGASRYFVRSHDAQSDLSSLLGFDDDAAVLNYVLVELGHDELRIQL
jgi:uncharacterized membrane protein YkvA (DUF1232 family)